MLDQFRINVGSILNQFRTNVAQFSGQCWNNFGSILDQFRTKCEPTFDQYRSNFESISLQLWVPRPRDKCTGGETGPRKRFPLLPGQNSAKKGPKQLKFKKFGKFSLDLLLGAIYFLGDLLSKRGVYIYIYIYIRRVETILSRTSAWVT